MSADSVWLVTDAKGVLARIDPKTGAIHQRIRVPPGSYNPLYEAERIWLTRADGEEVTVIDATSGAVVATTKTGPHPRFLAAGDGAVWTLNQRDSSLTRIEAGTHSPLDTIRLGTSGRGGDIGIGAELVWVTVRRIPLSAIDIATTRLLCQWVGDGGDSLGIGHEAIWLTDYDGGTVACYDLKDAANRCRSQAPGLVGTWRLTRYEDHPHEGAPLFPYGEHPEGRLSYDVTGHMFIQIMKTPHPKVASGDEDDVTPKEKIALYDAYVAYFGSYAVDAARHVVVHRVAGDLADVFVGRDEERPYELDGNGLILRPRWVSGGKHWEGVRVFERLE